jgi:hypothetical protein
MKSFDPRVSAIAAHLRSKLPSLNEMTDYAPTSATDLGPDITIPAVYLHILTSHYDTLRLRAEIAEMQPKVHAYEAWTNAMLTGQMAGEA